MLKRSEAPGGMAAVIPLSAVSLFGDRFVRPECVLTTSAGDVFVSDCRGGVSHILPNGERRLYVGGTLDLSEPLHPNGVALDRDGSFVIAHLGSRVGGIYRLRRDGEVTPILQQIEGRGLTSTNFVLLDAIPGRLWITVSTLQVPREKAFTSRIADGYIILVDERGPRVVADGLAFANECRIDPSGRWLYVNETYARQLTRFAIAPDGSLSHREAVTRFGPGDFPDGVTFDCEGAAWVTCVVSNRVIRVAPDGGQTVMIEEANSEHIAEVEEAYHVGSIPRSVLDKVRAKVFANVASLAFGGEDLRTGYFGVLLSDRLPTVRLPVAGAEPVHWHWR
jgi:sugar lactone lactonase YvrE